MSHPCKLICRHANVINKIDTIDTNVCCWVFFAVNMDMAANIALSLQQSSNQSIKLNILIDILPLSVFVVVCCFMFEQYLRSYHDTYPLVVTQGDFIVPPPWETRPPAPCSDIPLSHIILKLTQPVHVLF